MKGERVCELDLTWQEVGGRGLPVEVGAEGRETFSKGQQEVESGDGCCHTGACWERVVGVAGGQRRERGCVRGDELTWPPELV